MQKITMTKELKEKTIELYNMGLMDTEIANTLGISDSVVFYWRKKLNLKTKFTYDKIKKINDVEFEKLFYNGLNDREIAEKLNMSPDGIYSHRMRHGYIRRNYSESTPRKLTQFQKEVLFGTLLGDSSLRFPKKAKHASCTCMHGIKQQEYCKHKCMIFESIGATGKYHKRKISDPRTGIYYEDFSYYLPANPELDIWYDNFYQNGKKHIPFNLIKYLTPVSLAYWFMDDGSKTKNGYYLCTNCFELEELYQLQTILLEKFQIVTRLHKGNKLYITAKSTALFTYLISPYIHETMKYKLHTTVS